MTRHPSWRDDGWGTPPHRFRLRDVPLCISAWLGSLLDESQSLKRYNDATGADKSADERFAGLSRPTVVRDEPVSDAEVRRVLRAVTPKPGSEDNRTRAARLLRLLNDADNLPTEQRVIDLADRPLPEDDAS